MGSIIEKLGKFGELILGTPTAHAGKNRSAQPMDSMLEWVLAERNTQIDKRMELLKDRFNQHKIVITKIIITPLNPEAQEMVDLYLEMDTDDQVKNICDTLELPPDSSPVTKVECDENFQLSFGQFVNTYSIDSDKSYKIDISLQPRHLKPHETVSARTATISSKSSDKASNSQRGIMELTINDGNGARKISVNSLPFTIGKSKDNDLQFDSRYVSSSHLEISKTEAGKFQITDKSTNGTFWLDGTDISKSRPVEISSSQTVILALGRDLSPEEFQNNLKSDNKVDFPHITFKFGTPHPKPLEPNGTPKPKPLNN